MNECGSESSVAAVTAWIIDQATKSHDADALLRGVAEWLVAQGLPLLRATAAMPSIDPMYRAVSVIWEKGGKTSVEAADHDSVAEFEHSPIYHLLQRDLRSGRWRIGKGEGLDVFPILRRFAALGGTDYVVRLVSFAEEPVLLGISFSIVADDPAGFSEAGLAKLDAIMPVLGLGFYRLALSRTAREMLRIYVGPRTSERVLSGDVLRGRGQSIYAPILLADLRNFTALNETYPPERIVGWLNEHFEALGLPIAAENGEILKFMGDSLLAIFPVDPVCHDGDAPSGETGGTQSGGKDNPAAADAACRRALAAAEGALAATKALNQARAAAGEPAIEVDLVLHLGRVFYGNVGAARRLDFTVIGPAVNEAARMERLCDELGRHLLLSEAFSAHCGAPTENLGRFPLRGVREAQSVFALARQ